MDEVVKKYYAAFQAACRVYLPPPSQERLWQAYEYAQMAHQGQQRKTGEPYIIHPLQMATYLAELYMDEAVLTGALLHDVAEDTEYGLDAIAERFGPHIRDLVDGVTHLSNVSQLEDIAHMFLMMSSDVRVILIKLYDRLHNMKTLTGLPYEHRRRKALETLNIYVPLAAKLGIWSLKNDFESLILEQIDPDIYRMIQGGIAEQQREHVPVLEQVGQDLQQLLYRYGLPSGFRIKQRSPYRMYEYLKHHKLDAEAYRQAFQLILQVDSLPQAYLALGYIHEQYAHIAGSLADTIGNPRDIFYRSLHTAIVVPFYKIPVRLRIRTYEFDRQAEIGILAQLQFARPDEAKLPEHAPWLPTLSKLYEEADNAQKFVAGVFQDILQKQIVCFTPRGRELSLPRGATALDFAYYVHTDIGHECRGAIVNGDTSDLSRKLAHGDHVEIIRGGRTAPNHEWLDELLDYAITDRARQKIKEWFRRQPAKSLIRLGRDAVNDERFRLNTPEISPHMIAQALDLPEAKTLYLQVGNGNINISQVARAILQLAPGIFTESHQDGLEIHDHLGQAGWIRQVAAHPFHMSKCCQPRVGESILGNLLDSKGLIMIHRANCRYITQSRRSETLLRLEWQPAFQPMVMCALSLEGYDRGGLIRDLSIPIARLGGNISKFDSHIRQQMISLRLKVEMPNSDDLLRIIHRLGTLQNIRSVQRLSQAEMLAWDSQSSLADRPFAWAGD